MAAGRPVIVSNAGGNAEIVQDEVTGFIGEACERSFADAMERAWKRKEAWEDMGKKASSHVLSHVQANPPNLFADSINEILYEK
jgi:glycosyltransferase involved in cell wall biosynthesis